MFLQKLKIEIPFDPGIPLLGIYPKNAAAQFGKDICTPMFITVLFTIAKKWKQPECPSVDEWIKKMWYIYTMECYSAIRKKTDPTIRNNMDGARGHYAQRNKPGGERYVSNDFTHLWSIRTKEKLKEQNSSRITEPKNGLTVTKGKGTGENRWEERDNGEKWCYN